MSDLKELIKYIEVLEAEPFTGWTGANKKGYLTACTSIKKKAEKLAENLANGVTTGEKQCNLPVVMPRILHFVDENGTNVDLNAEGVNTRLKRDGTHEYFRSFGFAGIKMLTPVHGVTHRYFTLHEAKPENGKPCIVNNGADNYHIAFWDEKANGFVNQTGYLQKEFDKWLYLPINGG